MPLPIRTLSAFAGLVLAGQAGAEALIGFAAPLSGPSAILGEQMRTGVQMAAETLKDPGITLNIADDACTAEGGAKAARQFVAAKVRVVIGFLCSEAIEAAWPPLRARCRRAVRAGRPASRSWSCCRSGCRCGRLP